MQYNESRPTATILPFPERRSTRGWTATRLASTTGHVAETAWPTIESGSAWYHESALRETQRPRNS
jgi:hypothetical protein